MTQKYKNLEKLGEGTYGVVFKVRDEATGLLMAMKKVHKQILDEGEGIPQTAVREIGLLKRLSHPHIVKLIDVVISQSEVRMFLEYMDMDLGSLISKHPKSLTPDKIKKYIFQILLAVEFCHRRGVLHRDLKPHNILYDTTKDVVKLADFGLARQMERTPVSNFTAEVLTLWYRAPEVLMGLPRYGGAVDVWSVGCILGEMALKKPLLPGDCEIDQLFRIFRFTGTPTDQTWPAFSSMPSYLPTFPKWDRDHDKLMEKMGNLGDDGKDLLLKMLECDPARRITAAQALQHPYFKDVEK